MQQNEALLSPAPPQIKGALRNGFDSIANHIYLIAIPVIVDVFLWLGPHIRLKSLMQPILEAILSTPSRQIEQSIEVIRTNQELLLEWFTRLNLMIILRSFPIGIPSLMASRLPIDTPTGNPPIIEMYSFWHILILVLMIGLVGMILGTLFYIMIAQVALDGKINWTNLINIAPWAILQIVLMTCSFYLLVLIISLPISCMLSLFTMTGFTPGQLGTILLLGFMLWLFFPLILTPFGILVNHDNLLAAIKNSYWITRLTLPNTSLLFLIVLVLTQGLDLLWLVPQEVSWLTILGILGHAFVSTSILATIFIYYRDAARWTESLIIKMKDSKKII